MMRNSGSGRAALVERVKHRLDHLGGSMDPHQCYLLYRGMKTLALRVRQHNVSALEVARFLAQHPKVSRVNHPGLPGHPQHQRACSLFDGFGGMLSFEIEGGLPAAEAAHFALASTSVGEMIAEAGDEVLDKVCQSLTARFSRHQQDGAVWMDFCIHIFTGARL